MKKAVIINDILGKVTVSYYTDTYRYRTSQYVSYQIPALLQKFKKLGYKEAPIKREPYSLSYYPQSHWELVKE